MDAFLESSATGWHPTVLMAMIDKVETSEPDASGPVDVLSAESPRWRERWIASSRRVRAAVLVALVAGFAAVLVGAFAVHATPHHRVQTIVDPGPPPATTIDALGCPVTVHCVVRSTIPAGVRSAMLRAFPQVDVVSIQQIADVTGRTYRRVLLGEIPEGAGLTPGVVSVVAQCIPGGAAASEQTVRSADSSLDLAGNTVVHTRYLSVIVPGATGCSAHVFLVSPSSGQALEPGAITLAHDPVVQVTP
jgi:hypothetical protein